jgi:hypothetical protein
MEPEIVICAAVRAKDGTIIRGQGHADALRTLQGRPGYRDERPHGDDQGFITSRNRYVTRAEGLQLQLAAGIPSARDGYTWQLYSEDLY